MLRKIQISFKIVPQNTAKNCFRKLQLGQKNVAQNTKIKNEYSANDSFLKKIIMHFTVFAKYRNTLILLRKIQYEMLRKIQFFFDKCCAKYRRFCCAKYRFVSELFCKIQKRIVAFTLRKLQMLHKIQAVFFLQK